MGTLRAVNDGPPSPPASGPILAVSSNKGGVGKTTVSANLAIYLRALHEDLPILLVGLDDQQVLDRMFSLRGLRPGEGNLKHGWAERSFESVIQVGQYGVHFVPSPPDVGLLKARAENPRTLAGILARSMWPGLVILDTKSDLEELTLNAYHAADRVLIPVSDWSSLEEAGKSLVILERTGLGAQRARILFTLVDRRARSHGARVPLGDRLRAEVRRRGWPHLETRLSRSPRVEALNSAAATPQSILHHARGTSIHREMRALAEEITKDLGLGREQPAPATRADWGRRMDDGPEAPRSVRRAASDSLARTLLGH